MNFISYSLTILKSFFVMQRKWVKSQLPVFIVSSPVVLTTNLAMSYYDK